MANFKFVIFIKLIFCRKNTTFWEKSIIWTEIPEFEIDKSITPLPRKSWQLGWYLIWTQPGRKISVITVIEQQNDKLLNIMKYVNSILMYFLLQNYHMNHFRYPWTRNKLNTFKTYSSIYKSYQNACIYLHYVLSFSTLAQQLKFLLLWKVQFSIELTDTVYLWT